MALQVNPQNQVYRHADVRQMPVPSDQGMFSMGVQGGSSTIQSDSYSGSDSSTANTALTAVQQSRGAALLTQQLETYLITLQQSSDDVNQRNERIAVNIMQTGPCAMTATMVESARAKAKRHYAKVLDFASDTITCHFGLLHCLQTHPLSLQ